MIGELNLNGVFVTPLLFCVGLAWVLCEVLKSLFAVLGVYRLVWHRPLFDFALLIVLTGCAAAWVGQWLERGLPR
jgi:hypothetical protein